MTPASNLARFWTKVDRRGPDECWPWNRGKYSSGYGTFWANGRNHAASRWLLAQTLGRELTGDEVARHTCDNPPCCNPAHLIPGTQLDNMGDARDRGRLAQVGDQHWARLRPENICGEKNAAAKLTDDQVRDIRALYAAGAFQKDLAAEYGITQPQVSLIVRRKAWPHI